MDVFIELDGDFVLVDQELLGSFKIIDVFTNDTIVVLVDHQRLLGLKIIDLLEWNGMWNNRICTC